MSLRQRDCHFQCALPFATVDGEDTVTHDALYRFGIVVVVLIGCFRIRIHSVGLYRTGEHHQTAHLFAQVGVVRHLLCQDVHCALERRIRIRHFFREERLCRLHRVCSGILRHQRPCQRLQATGDRHRRTGLSLGTIRQVQILRLHQSLRFLYLFRQFRGQLALGLDGGKDLALALFQLAQVLQPVVDGTQHLVIQRAGPLFPVACNKGDGLAVIQQGDGVVDLFLPQLELVSQFLWDIQYRFTPFRFCLNVSLL